MANESLKKSLVDSISRLKKEIIDCQSALQKEIEALYKVAQEFNRPNTSEARKKVLIGQDASMNKRRIDIEKRLKDKMIKHDKELERYNKLS